MMSLLLIRVDKRTLHLRALVQPEGGTPRRLLHCFFELRCLQSATSGPSSLDLLLGNNLFFSLL